MTIFACTSTSKFYTTNVQDITSFESKSILYALPMTHVAVKVEVVKHTIIPGPYYLYAKKYLGIDGAPSVSDVKWEIANIDLGSFSEPDPDHYYSVTNDKSDIIRNHLLNFTRAGLIIAPGYQEELETGDKIITKNPTEVYFTDLSVKRNFPKVSNPETGEVLYTAEMERMPTHRKYLEAKTLEKKAEEAANFIIKTRKRRFKLLAGQYEVFPNGEALETSVHELNKIEEEYLSLFCGRVYSDTITEVFVVDPKTRQELQRQTIFRFSEENGILDSNTSAGKAVILEIKDLGQTKILEHMMIPGSSPTKENMLFYRIPDNAEVKVLYGSHELLVKRLSIYQLGAIVPYFISEKAHK